MKEECRPGVAAFLYISHHGIGYCLLVTKCGSGALRAIYFRGPCVADGMKRDFSLCGDGVGNFLRQEVVQIERAGLARRGDALHIVLMLGVVRGVVVFAAG